MSRTSQLWKKKRKKKKNLEEEEKRNILGKKKTVQEEEDLFPKNELTKAKMHGNIVCFLLFSHDLLAYSEASASEENNGEEEESVE